MTKFDASEEELEEALIKAEAFDFVMNFPSKLDTFVGSGGSQLSETKNRYCACFVEKT